MKKEIKIYLIIMFTFTCLIIGLSLANQAQKRAVQEDVLLLNDNSIQSQIDDIVRRTANHQGIPGISVAVKGYSSETIFSSYGYTRQGGNIEVDEDTFFSLGSLSKAFAAMAILYLDNSNEFDFSLNDPVQNHIEWLNFRHNDADFNMSELTVANFVYHTSGLVNEIHSLSLPPSDGDNAAREIVQLLNNSMLEFRPGTRYDYASSNYIIIGLIIQYVTGISFEKFMTTRILTPLGMDNTFMFEYDAKEAGVMSSAHKPSWLVSRPFNPPTFRAHTPTGFIISSTKDMVRWMELHLNPEAAPEPFNTLLVMALEPNTDVEAWEGYHYSAGWLIEYEKGKIRHEGESPGFLSEVIMLPDSGIGVIVFKNSSAGDAANLMENILLILDGEEPGEISFGSDFRVFDMVFVGLNIISMITIIPLCIFGITRIISIKKGSVVRTKLKLRSLINLILALLFFVGFLFITITLPSMFGVGTWNIASIWLPSTILTGLVLLTVTGGLWTIFAILGIFFQKSKISF